MLRSSICISCGRYYPTTPLSRRWSGSSYELSLQQLFSRDHTKEGRGKGWTSDFGPEFDNLELPNFSLIFSVLHIFLSRENLSASSISNYDCILSPFFIPHPS
ncbi:hypothetical protein TNCV_4704081 [Trichonephila clavipes]|nr:hypothetical protein TNCV_4704081 [Trichonephila clavipes]